MTAAHDIEKTSETYSSEEGHRTDHPVHSKRPAADGTGGDKEVGIGERINEEQSIISRAHSRDVFGIDLPRGLALTAHPDGVHLVLTFATPPAYPTDPLSWSIARRSYMTLLASLSVLAIALASTTPTGAADALSAYFGVSNEATILTVSLYLLGYCAGPLIMAPGSEAIGRKKIFMIGMMGLSLFSMAAAVNDSFGGLLAIRFISGVFGSAPNTNSGSTTGDLWPPKVRGFAMSFYSIATFSGPALGPLLGGFSSLDTWRWSFGIIAILSGIIFFLLLFTFDEVYPPLLLKHAARQLRQETGKDYITCRMELAKAESARLGSRRKQLTARAEIIFGRPFVMITTEPILQLVSLFMATVYGLTYILFAAYPIVFQEIRGLTPGQGGLPFLSILIGAILSVPVNLWYQQRYVRLVREAGKSEPEMRLPQSVLGGTLIAGSFFWLGWTGYKASIHVLAPASSGIMMGLGVVLVFRSMQIFIVDAFGDYSASAQCANVIVRSAFGAAFPLFAPAMMHNLGVEWACTLLGCLMLVLVPIPLLFIHYGPYLRRNSKYCPSR